MSEIHSSAVIANASVPYGEPVRRVYVCVAGSDNQWSVEVRENDGRISTASHNVVARNFDIQNIRSRSGAANVARQAAAFLAERKPTNVELLTGYFGYVDG